MAHGMGGLSKGKKCVGSMCLCHLFSTDISLNPAHTNLMTLSIDIIYMETTNDRDQCRKYIWGYKQKICD